jgi:hypothetical protein
MDITDAIKLYETPEEKAENDKVQTARVEKKIADAKTEKKIAEKRLADAQMQSEATSRAIKNDSTLTKEDVNNLGIKAVDDEREEKVLKRSTVC